MLNHKYFFQRLGDTAVIDPAELFIEVNVAQRVADDYGNRLTQLSWKNWLNRRHTQLYQYFERFDDSPNSWRSGIQLSNYTCGIMEIGLLWGYHVTIEMEQRVLSSLIYALWWRRGIVFYYQPVGYDDHWPVPFLTELGFEPGRTFYNPNSGHNVQEYSCILPTWSTLWQIIKDELLASGYSK